ncbi:Bifunctional purine biosynthesis protein PurH [Dissostichus eleginoides]|uniref:Bifunctional purine biosynthesis protein PurH n=1 Tax=Dissostichus eleginoides TaxID=100907 RepID=A0AAD9F9B1_DISEL|nr:Bifunctional purine biosynthesis protein PurH [Dissostichus eleginoides]
MGYKKKRGSLDRLQIAGNYGNYLGSKVFCCASDASSRAEGSGRFLPRERGEMAVYPKRKRLTRLSRRRKKGGGESKGKKEGSVKRKDLFLPLAEYLSDLKPRLMLKAPVKTLLEPGAASTQSPGRVWVSLSGLEVLLTHPPSHCISLIQLSTEA